VAVMPNGQTLNDVPGRGAAVADFNGDARGGPVGRAGRAG